ncbi:MAG TPA: MdtA/MuxA family multidrug efflux RND transporter periplasmic adaptor subunit [Stellaceae bacterium]|nr:MdtA/MuxA family multidrug efflux RND transporter periplasmic adaptor subunit [Stellaceae bacterium]
MDDRPGNLREVASETRRPARRSLWPRLLWLLLGIAIIGALAWIILRPHAPAPRSGRINAGSMPVVAATATTGDMPVLLNALGTVTPLATVTVRTQINGQLVQLGFREGQEVNQGDFLALIDPRPYQAALDNAQGVLTRDQAQLENAKRDLARYTKLVAENSIAQQQRDTQEALVKQLTGTVASDQAQVDNAKLNLAYCRIVAPVGGRLGLRQVDVGNYVQVSDANGIAVITQLKPISVIFTLPEDTLPPILKRLNAGAQLEVTAWDRAGKVKLATGVLTTLDNQIDTSTGTFKLRAQFDNGDEILFPNQFVNTQLLVDTLHGAILVPNAAIQRGAPGTFVYVIGADNTVAVRAVKLGPGDANRVAIDEGLAAGDRVVVDGADKLRDGAKVTLPAEGGSAAGGRAPASANAPAVPPEQGSRRSQP